MPTLETLGDDYHGGWTGWGTARSQDLALSSFLEFELATGFGNAAVLEIRVFPFQGFRASSSDLFQ
jgi:hypothetical protein